ncbi:MAG: hypothetical protein K0Q51_422 [Rickettsiaceae bacterium]|jgi:Xaa-Pro aminopeptidase|nr:hypothetical protein [Rickettsiaceae bacterium]
MIEEKLINLRTYFENYNIDGYIVPSTDEYQGEYTADYAKRLQYITNFSGSNGIAIIFKDKAVLLTDGRYLTQAEKELDLDRFKILDITKLCTLNWQEQGIRPELVLGFDPKLFIAAQLRLFKDFNLKAVEANLIDSIWQNQPSRPASRAYIYPLEYAGISFTEKLKKIQDKLKEKHANHCLITASDSLCWLLNIRASDIEYVPFLHGYLIVSLEGSVLFTNTKRIGDIKDYLQGFVSIKGEEEIIDYLANLAGKVLVDETSVPVFFIDLLKKHGREYENIQDPCMLLKACKNAIEIQHMTEGHIKDAVALCEFFAWLEEAINNQENLDEYLLGEKLIEFRGAQQGFVFPSFSSICGFQDNGAVIHYKAAKETAKTIKGQGLLLIDSGGQYVGATTDITRTIIVGSPTQEQILRYTEVLKGHIRLGRAKFPKGITGAHLDVLARFDLWQDEVDYAHGTGHGVGAFLSVHEGPQRISSVSHVPLLPGMVLSNEPGFYKVGEFGIRIENLLYVKQSSSDRFLEFENLTLVPYCLRLIDLKLLSRDEISYIKDYYHIIKVKILPLLSEKAKKWALNEINGI